MTESVALSDVKEADDYLQNNVSDVVVVTDTYEQSVKKRK